MISLRKGSGNQPGKATPAGSTISPVQGAGPAWAGVALAVVAGLVLVGLLVAIGFVSVKKVSLSNQVSERGCFLAAAEESMDLVLNVNDGNLDDQVAAILDGSTGAFQREFESGAEQYKTLVRDAKAESIGQVISSAVRENDDRKATVLVLGSRTVTNLNVETPLDEDYRAIIVVEKVDGVCKTAKMDWAIA